MYYIIQTEGTKRDAANLLKAAIKVGDIATAAKIYETETGEKGSQPETLENIWWTHNAADRIRTNYNVDLNHVRNMVGKDAMICSEEWAKAEAYLATKKYGGKWSVVYEY